MSDFSTTPEVPCPQCGKRLYWTSDNPWRPFCSKRCRTLDLGAWADESHRIAGEPALDEANIEELMERLERGDNDRR